MFSDLPELARVLSQCFGGSKVCFEEEQTAFATSFYHIAQLALAVSYPQSWDLFFFIFFILSLF
jgi:hypothetical protein